jgi:hypothetical protein
MTRPPQTDFSAFPPGVTLGETTVYEPAAAIRLGVNAFYLGKSPKLQLAVYRLFNGLFNLAPVVKEESGGGRSRILSLPVPPEALPKQAWEHVLAEMALYMVVSKDWDHGVEDGEMTNGFIHPPLGTADSYGYYLHDFESFVAHLSPESSVASRLQAPRDFPEMPELTSSYAKAKFHQIFERFSGAEGRDFFTEVLAKSFQAEPGSMAVYYEHFMRHLDEVKTAFNY